MDNGTGILKKIVLGFLGFLILYSIFEFFVLHRGGIRSILIALVIFIVIAVVWKTKKSIPVNNNNNTEHGSARWATQQEITNAIDPDKKGEKGLFLGGGYIRTKAGHAITIAGSGQGKGTCLLIPTLLLYPSGSYVVTDPKGENACITAAWQKFCMQDVYIIDPWDEQKRIGAEHGIEPIGFNPFDFLTHNMSELRDNCELIASSLVPENPGEKDPYWNDRARTLIRLMLMHIITGKEKEEHNFWTLYKMLRRSGDAWIGQLIEMTENESLDGLISLGANEFLGMDESGTALSGIRSSAQNATTIFESPQLRKSLETSGLNPYSLTNGMCSVYIVIPERYIETHGTWLRLVIGLCLKACNAQPKERVYFLLDEFAVLGKMKEIQKAYAFARGQNINMWFFAQSLSQIKEIYGEDGMNTFLSNSAVLQAFGVKDQFTKEYISKALGDTTYMKQSTSISTSSVDGSTNQSVNYQSFGRPLLTPEEVETTDGIITITEGLKTTFHKKPYYKNSWANLKGNEEFLTKEQKQQIKSGKILEESWYQYFKERADPAPRVYK